MQKGLKGVIAVETTIGHVDGEQGLLLYRGQPVETLTGTYSFEEVAFFLWYGHFPSPTEKETFTCALKQARSIPPYLQNVLQALPLETDQMSVVRTAISALGLPAYSFKPTIEEAITLTGIMPSIIAWWHRRQAGQPYLPARSDLDHVENYLYMLTGETHSHASVRALENYMILTMEHGMNASTFAARVTVSSESDLVSSITSALGTMKGPLHGGAPSGVIALLDEIAASDGDCTRVLTKKLQQGERLMGFGHRVYKTKDPRAQALKAQLLQTAGDDPWLDLALQTETTAIELLQAYKPGRSLYTNVEFYAAAIMKAIGLAPSLFTPTFSASRVVGWSAHVLEQAADNTIFRPDAAYVGSWPQA
ncbi:citrate synthase I [Fictibacillus macauensis ZFHKF-1]|uniref:Citrate synthase n=2 Tax=Fictibacillus TaxID=1329200 RepID=I8AM24_9BACL|nr:citrate synthase I [Fictibacillus macauensis ZFHKF-1]